MRGERLINLHSVFDWPPLRHRKRVIDALLHTGNDLGPLGSRGRGLQRREPLTPRFRRKTRIRGEEPISELLMRVVH